MTDVKRMRLTGFDLIVVQDKTELERFQSVSMQSTLDYYVATIVNNQNSGSRYITVTDQKSGSGLGVTTPAPVTQVPLASGSDGADPKATDYIGDPTKRNGLYAFDTVAIQLLACPETTSTAVTTAALTYCANRGDAMFVGTAPYGFDLEGIKTYASAFKGSKVYGALYGPWIQVVNPDVAGRDPIIWIPPVGHVLGMYARIADQRGVWKAPAGDAATLNNALGVAFAMTDADHTDLVRNGSVNGIRALPGVGIVVDASRTLSTDTRWLYVGTRRLFNFVKSSVRDGLRFVVQEPNTDELRRTVKFSAYTVLARPVATGRLWLRSAGQSLHD